ncbi:Radical SAM domain protein [Halorhabdus utahensis DSM 12940]|uniref:Radical SAM domain protein n=1 Tax=Halorhabdus utahensis (strain DSM 12940 / JCM 11049 / AX-2) TaxID=519442 RepID=C7NS44_HALUD|nr:AmmeMemoRadiSam system radical SAM enzyme [Halorhabdus utahensis]ACV10651.1 Radical SAM domain protein [Halorhabdus utahensis DSM 12940]
MAQTDSTGDGEPASLAEPAEGEGVRCTACAHRCTLSPGQRGICDVRKNVDGELRLLTYGNVHDPSPGPPGTADPIEKKPLYHFHPTTRVLSFGGASCNFACQFCQNHHIAFAEPEDVPLRDVSPAEATASATKQDCAGVAWTYNEPTIYAEYVRDAAREARQAGLYTAIVTNGYFTEEFVTEVAPHLDAANVDIKGFRDRAHVEYMGARVEPTLRGAESLYETDTHLEITYLTIPDLNDDPAEIRAFAEWVRADLDRSVPVHFTRFHPDHNMRDRPATPVDTLERAAAIARDVGLEFVYVGNVPGHADNDTRCPDCGATWIRRNGFRTSIEADLDGKCECGRDIDVVV